MRDFNKRRTPWQSLLRFALRFTGLIALALLVLVMVRATWGMYQKFSEAAGQSEMAQQNLAALQAQTAQIGAEVTALSTARGVEGQLRQEYGVAKPGEGEIDIVRDTPTSSVSAAPESGLLARIFHAILPF